MKAKIKALSLLGTVMLFFIFNLIPSVNACTIWAARGENVQGGGTLIAKNRDNLTGLYTALKTVFPEKGNAFSGLFDVEADGYVVAGVNDKGLAVVNSSANSIPDKQRLTATEDVTEKLLLFFSSVDDILAEKDFFRKTHPALYIIGDAMKIASVEVAPNGRVSIEVHTNGTLALTNHYTSASLTDINERISKRNLMRLGHINRLLSRQTTRLTMASFIAFSNSKGEKPEEALWRDGGSSGKIRTLAGWMVFIPLSGPPELYIRLANPLESEIIQTFTLDDTFWIGNKNNR